MKDIFKNISGKIDASIVSPLLEIREITKKFDIPFLVIGATARDCVMEHCYGVKAPRRTMDLDLGIQVPDWESYEKLTESLLAKGKFKKAKEKQRYKFGNILVDMIPFGGVCDTEKNIKWPPEQEIIISTLGFEEAHDNSITLRINKNPAMDIRVPTIPGLAILKLISWADNPPLREKDSQDLFFVMDKYESAGIEDRLFNEESDLLKEEGFDNQLAGIRLLGRDMAKICNSNTRKRLEEILAKETNINGNLALIGQIIGKNDNYDEALSFLEKLKQGFLG